MVLQMTTPNNPTNNPSLEEVQEAVRVINAEFLGIGAYLIDHRDCGEGLKIGLNTGDAIEIAEIMADDAEITASFLPKGTFVEAVNGECLRLVKI